MIAAAFARATLVLAAVIVLSLAAQERVLALPGRAAASVGTAVAARTLANGLRVFVVEDHAAPVIQTAMWYRFGSLDEDRGKTGLAHGLEHMMFRGTRAISGGGLDDIGARMGAVVNANTAEDYTHFYFVMPADRLDLALHIEADRMRGLLLRPADWALEKGAVLSEYDGDTSQPAFALAAAVRRAAFAESPFGRTALGVRADVVRARASDLRAYYNRFYQPNNASLVVTGDVRPAGVFAAAARYFAAIPARTLPIRAPLPLGRASSASVTVAADNPNALLDCAYRIPGDLDPDAAATQVFAGIISNSRSPLYRSLVLSHLALNYNAYADTALHAGIFHVVISVRPGVDVARVRRAFAATMARIVARGVDPDLLIAAKTAGAREAVYARDSISGLGDRYGYALGVEGHDPADDDRAVDALDTGTMNAALKRYFTRVSVTGTLVSHAAAPAGARITASPTAAGDDFANRPPSGPIALAAWARVGVERPLRIVSSLAPRLYYLPNGLRLYVTPVRANPTVFVSGNIDVSPAFDPVGKTGLGALTADLLQYGSRRYDYEALLRAGDRLGADLNFGFQFGAHGLARNLDSLLDILAATERAPAFPAPYVALARDQEIAGVLERVHSPDARAERAFLGALYRPGDPILREETVRSLRAITPADLRAYASRFMRPDRTTIVVAGDVSPAAVRRAVARAFGSWRNLGRAPAVAVLPLAPARPAVRYVSDSRETVNVRLGEQAVGRLSPDFPALNLINNVLGADGTFDTRLMHEIREQRGLVYDVSSALSVSRERGTLEISFTAAPRNVRTAVRLVEANLERLRSQPISRGELARARTKIVAGTLVSEEATQTLVNECESIARYGLSTGYYRTFGASYARYSPTELLRVARRYIRPDQLVQVYEGPTPSLANVARKIR